MTDRRQDGDDTEKDTLFLRQRTALNNAYAALVGYNTAQTFAAYTFEEAADARIEAIEGADTQQHPNQLKRVEKIRGELKSAVQQIKAVDPSVFQDVESDELANPVDDEG